MKIAVIGGGIAGLASGWLLSREHEVTLFERRPQAGLVASSATIDLGGRSHRVDMPLRVFYPGYYPRLVRLYAELGVDTEPVSYATSFSGGDGDLYFRFRNLGWGATSLAYVLPQDLLTVRARRIVWSALRFNRLARTALQRGELAGVTIGGFAAAKRLAPEFVDGVLLPAIATVGTCTTEDARAYPADVVAAYMAAGLTQQSVRRACQGADDVAARLMAKIARVRCNVAVHQLKRVVGGVALASHGQAVERFDHVVLATQANHAGALLADATPAEASVLGAFRYRALEVLMHRDASLMPARRADWSPVHAWVSAAHERPESTIWINRVQPELRVSEPIFQTVQPQRRPRDELMIASASFERPLVDAASQRAVQELQVLHAQPERRLWLCGSYAQAGVPLLESAVRSAYAVAQAIAMQSTSAHSRDAGAAA